jgi:hypothetical protein
MSDIVKKSNESGCEDIGLVRNCPKCNKQLHYRSLRCFKNAIKLNTPCAQCGYFGNDKQRKIIGITRTCPKCNQILTYSSSIGCYNANRKNSICNTCAAQGQYTIEKQKRMAYGLRKKSKSDSWAMKVANVRRKNGTYVVTEEVREKHRINKINRMMANGTLIWPNYNLKACLIFDKLEKDIGWHGLYATKGKEKRIGRFWVDYYEPIRNVIIEYDEPYHYDKNGELKEKR